jgi:hypothetical protein
MAMNKALRVKDCRDYVANIFDTMHQKTQYALAAVLEILASGSLL